MFPVLLNFKVQEKKQTNKQKKKTKQTKKHWNEKLNN